MSGIIKRRQNANFAQIQNHVLQSLSDLRAIGLIAHLLSMSTNWTIRKMHLYKKFSRATVTNGIAVLEEHRYWVDIEFRDGSRNIHAYHISDVAFTDAEVSELIKEIREEGFQINNVSEAFRHLLTGKKEENLCHFSYVDSLQSKINSSFSTVENRQLLNKEKQINSKQINNNQRNIVNLQEANTLVQVSFKQAITEACNELYPKYAQGRWSKQAWKTLIDTFISETIDTGRYKQILSANIPAYAQAAITKMAHAFDLKNGRKTIDKAIPSRPVPFYDWVSE